jgi:hypothetical protein
MESEIINKLKAEGWTQQFTASGSRLEEAVENYRKLGFEVKTVPVKDLNQNGCTICFEDANDETVMIFTRNRRSIKDDLFDD